MSVEIDSLATADSTRYTPRAIAYHWFTALLVLVVGTIGVFFDGYPKSQFLGWLTVHALLGLTIFFLVIARVRWRIEHTPPDLPGEVGEFTRRTSHAAHMLLYFLLFITPIFGVAGFIAHGRTLVFGSVHIGFPYPPTKSVFKPVEAIHQWLAYSVFALAGVHVAAALWHHFVLRDNLIYRIWPRLREMSRNEKLGPRTKT
jgi:cytochrome b561